MIIIYKIELDSEQVNTRLFGKWSSSSLNQVPSIGSVRLCLGTEELGADANILQTTRLTCWCYDIYNVHHQSSVF